MVVRIPRHRPEDGGGFRYRNTATTLPPSLKSSAHATQNHLVGSRRRRGLPSPRPGQPAPPFSLRSTLLADRRPPRSTSPQKRTPARGGNSIHGSAFGRPPGGSKAIPRVAFLRPANLR